MLWRGLTHVSHVCGREHGVKDLPLLAMFVAHRCEEAFAEDELTSTLYEK